MPDDDTDATPASAASVAQVAALFAAAFEKPANYFDVGEELAEKLVRMRLGKLGPFADRRSPPDIRENFEDAIKLTAGCHEFAKTFGGLSEMVAPLRKLSDNDLWTVAKLDLDKSRPKGDLEFAEYAEDIARVRDDTFLAIIKELQNPTGQKNLADIVRAEFADRDESDLIGASLEATLLSARQNSLSVARDAMLGTAQIGMICRGMFYRTIVESQGSRTARPAAERAFEGHCHMSRDSNGNLEFLVGDRRDDDTMLPASSPIQPEYFATCHGRMLS